MDEKEKRNSQIYMDKEGIDKLTQTKPVRKQKTYDELARKYNLSMRRIYEIIRRYRIRYNPKKVRNLN